MNLKKSVMLTNDHDNEMDDSDIQGPRIVKKGYIYNQSIESEINDTINMEYSEAKNPETAGLSKHAAETKNGVPKKNVRFNEKLEIILIKSYKKFNRTGKHDNACICRLF